MVAVTVSISGVPPLTSIETGKLDILFRPALTIKTETVSLPKPHALIGSTIDRSSASIAGVSYTVISSNAKPSRVTEPSEPKANLNLTDGSPPRPVKSCFAVTQP